jgi:hypothetical protein
MEKFWHNFAAFSTKRKERTTDRLRSGKVFGKGATTHHQPVCWFLCSDWTGQETMVEGDKVTGMGERGAAARRHRRCHLAHGTVAQYIDGTRSCFLTDARNKEVPIGYCTTIYPQYDREVSPFTKLQIP